MSCFIACFRPKIYDQNDYQTSKQEKLKTTKTSEVAIKIFEEKKVEVSPPNLFLDQGNSDVNTETPSSSAHTSVERVSTNDSLSSNSSHDSLSISEDRISSDDSSSNKSKTKKKKINELHQIKMDYQKYQDSLIKYSGYNGGSSDKSNVDMQKTVTLSRMEALEDLAIKKFNYKLKK